MNIVPKKTTYDVLVDIKNSESDKNFVLAKAEKIIIIK